MKEPRTFVINEPRFCEALTKQRVHTAHIENFYELPRILQDALIVVMNPAASIEVASGTLYPSVFLHEYHEYIREVLAGACEMNGTRPWQPASLICCDPDVHALSNPGQRLNFRKWIANAQRMLRRSNHDMLENQFSMTVPIEKIARTVRKLLRVKLLWERKAHVEQIQRMPDKQCLREAYIRKLHLHLPR